MSIYPFLSWLRHACGIVVWQLKVVIQVCHVLTFPLPTAPQTVQLVYINERLLFSSALASHKNFNFILTFVPAVHPNVQQTPPKSTLT